MFVEHSQLFVVAAVILIFVVCRIIFGPIKNSQNDIGNEGTASWPDNGNDSSGDQ
jgi:hypothetical protein